MPLEPPTYTTAKLKILKLNLEHFIAYYKYIVVEV